jgi:hypothetical protein
MRHLSVLLAVFAVPAFADDKAKPNTLTPKAIAEGWILLFDGETTFGWKVEGDVKVQGGVLHVGGEKDSSITAAVRLSRFRSAFEYSTDGSKWESNWLGVLPDSVFFKHKAPLGESGMDVESPVVGHDGDPKVREAIRFVVPAGKRLHLRSIRLLPVEMTPLFNAKDLTGWKHYDPAKAKAADPKAKEVKVRSKYTVTKEGWLNVKDGPGDLQTEGQWADFVLQLECISNGKHLNSGLFFRCIPDLYQQGYEAQIRNQWEGDDRTKPVDFGTGAIYRRQAARKVMSTDGEWFTMTVAAHGRHIATWVNGYQVVDWTDDRKESDNARQGFKKSKGAISIQGHDPTTDLSFRNIRIQSLDK